MAQLQQISTKQVKGLDEQIGKLNSVDEQLQSLAQIKSVGDNLLLSDDGVLSAKSPSAQWLPNHDYQAGELVLNNNILYAAQEDFTSGGVFSEEHLHKVGGEEPVIPEVILYGSYQDKADGANTAKFINDTFNVDKVSIGAGSVTTRDAEVSIGNEGAPRFLANVKDGEANTDAATYKQVHEVNQKLWTIEEPESTADIVPGESENVDFPISGTDWENMKESISALDGRVGTIENDYLTSADIMTAEEFEEALNAPANNTLDNVSGLSWIQDVNTGTRYWVSTAPTKTVAGSGHIWNGTAVNGNTTAIPAIATPSQYAELTEPTTGVHLETITTNSYVLDSDDGKVWQVSTPPTKTATGMGGYFVSPSGFTPPMETMPKIKTPSQYIASTKPSV